MDCSLVLTTLSGVTIKVSLSVAKFDRFENLEDQVMDYLVLVADLKVFGCSIDFPQTATQTYLEDPIWDRLQQGMAYTVVFKDSSVILPSQEQLEGTLRHGVYPISNGAWQLRARKHRSGKCYCGSVADLWATCCHGPHRMASAFSPCPIHQVPLAVHVPMNPEEIVPEGAFAGVPRLRHVSVKSGIRLIGAEAWQNCRQLRIVKLPATVVGISDDACRDCKLLNSVSALDTRPLRNAVTYNGCVHRKGLQTSSAMKPSSGNTSFKGVLTLLRLP